MEQLNSVRRIVKRIGRRRLEQMLEKTTNDVSNWLAAKRFPPNTYRAMIIELDRLGFGAPPHLWKQIEWKPPTRKEDCGSFHDEVRI